MKWDPTCDSPGDLVALLLGDLLGHLVALLVGDLMTLLPGDLLGDLQISRKTSLNGEEENVAGHEASRWKRTKRQNVCIG